MMRNNFCVFILTHGRPDNIKTIATLKKHGYTGRIYYIVDNEDKTIPRYKELYGDQVVIFDKKAMADSVDEGNNFDERRTITHARNVTFQIAESLGIDYFIQLDDDYTNFRYRFPKEDILTSLNVVSLDRVFDAMVDFLKRTDTLSIAMVQGGDLIGGSDAYLKYFLGLKKRKAMNSFVCKTDRKFQFVGAMNEDVNTYVTLGSRGKLFFSTALVQLNQTQTQVQEGGITDMYLLYGTYCKAFTTVMMHPSSVIVSVMGPSGRRLHHRIKWEFTVPKILSEKHKRNESNRN